MCVAWQYSSQALLLCSVMVVHARVQKALSKRKVYAGVVDTWWLKRCMCMRPPIITFYLHLLTVEVFDRVGKASLPYPTNQDVVVHLPTTCASCPSSRCPPNVFPAQCFGPGLPTFNCLHDKLKEATRQKQGKQFNTT